MKPEHEAKIFNPILRLKPKAIALGHICYSNNNYN